MSGRSWGRTGRVTLDDHVLPGVLVGGRLLGFYSPMTRMAHMAHISMGRAAQVPDLDHAVMWVLRRAAPEVWRAERPVVWQVIQDPDGTWCARTAPGQPFDYTSGHGWKWAVAAADRRSRDEYAEYVRTTR